ncbi:MAG: class I SAM-dependent methyltransferase [Planctomycetota bacterium]
MAAVDAGRSLADVPAFLEPFAMSDRTPPDWTRLPGLARGTWQYVHERTIARRYHQFVADTPLCSLDVDYVIEHLGEPGIRRSQGAASHSGDATDKLSTDATKQHWVLDLGAGNGRVAVPIAEKGYHVLAVDLSQPMLEELIRQGTASRVLPLRANLVQMDGVRSSIADHAVCLFSTLGMIQGAEHRLRCLREARRIVRPGGSLILHVHWVGAALREPGGFRQLVSGAWKSLRRTNHEFGDSTYAYRGLREMYLHRFSLREVRKLLRASGWKLRHVDWISEDGSEITRSRFRASGFFVVAEAALTVSVSMSGG